MSDPAEDADVWVDYLALGGGDIPLGCFLAFLASRNDRLFVIQRPMPPDWTQHPGRRPDGAVAPSTG